MRLSSQRNHGELMVLGNDPPENICLGRAPESLLARLGAKARSADRSPIKGDLANVCCPASLHPPLNANVLHSVTDCILLFSLAAVATSIKHMCYSTISTLKPAVFCLSLHGLLPGPLLLSYSVFVFSFSLFLFPCRASEPSPHVLSARKYNGIVSHCVVQRSIVTT